MVDERVDQAQPLGVSVSDVIQQEGMGALTSLGQSDLLERLRDMGMVIGNDRDLLHVPPAETLFLHRKIGGMYLLATKLRARVDLGLPPSGHVIVMSRVFRTALETQADKIYQRSVDPVQTSSHDLPEEVRWLSMFRSAQWKGVDERFWSRYAVLTDAPDLARQMIDEATASALMQWPDDAVQADTPLMLMRLRGKLQLRLQLNRPRHPASELAALDVFAVLLLLFGR